VESDDSFTIKVTDYHIKHGKRGDCSYCPIALAIADVVKHSPALDGPFWKIIQVYDHCEINIRGKRYVTSIEASKFMTSFDDMLEVSPVEFVLVPHSREDSEDEYGF
jgi:hypothetical protein